MNQYEVADAIAVEIPTIKDEIVKTIHRRNPFAIIRILTNYTKKMVEQHNLKMVERCIKIMDRFYTKGDLLIKNAIENIFVFSFDSILAPCDASEKIRLLAKVPVGLYSVYIKQVYKSGV